MSDKKNKIKTPPRGGDAAAAWEHHLKPHEKEALAQEYQAQQAQKLELGKKVLLLIVSVNAGLAVASIFTGFNAILFGARLLMCLALFLCAPGIKLLFPVGALASVVMLSAVWMNPADSETFSVVFSVVETACLIVSSLILLIDENVSEYIYAKQTR